MGRGRAKAKQTKVARDLKYRTHETDFGALAQELHGDETDSDRGRRPDEPDEPDEYDEWSDYSDGRDSLTAACQRLVRVDRACPARCGASARSQMPRSRPAARMRCSAIRSAATAGGTPVGRGQREHLARGVEDLRRRAAGPARSRSRAARRRPGSGRRRSRSSRGRRGCRGRPAASPCPGGPAGCWRPRTRPGRSSTATTSSVSASPRAQGA